MRSRFVWHDGQWMPRAEWEAQRVAASGVSIVRDFTDAVWNPADGQHHTSRTTYEAATRAAGCVEIGRTEANRMRERGNQPAHTMPPVRDTLRRFLNEG